MHFCAGSHECTSNTNNYFWISWVLLSVLWAAELVLQIMYWGSNLARPQVLMSEPCKCIAPARIFILNHLYLIE